MNKLCISIFIQSRKSHLIPSYYLIEEYNKGITGNPWKEEPRKIKLIRNFAEDKIQTMPIKGKEESISRDTAKLVHQSKAAANKKQSPDSAR